MAQNSSLLTGNPFDLAQLELAFRPLHHSGYQEKPRQVWRIRSRRRRRRNRRCHCWEKAISVWCQLAWRRRDPLFSPLGNRYSHIELWRHVSSSFILLCRKVRTEHMQIFTQNPTPECAITRALRSAHNAWPARSIYPLVRFVLIVRLSACWRDPQKMNREEEWLHFNPRRAEQGNYQNHS